MKQRIKSFLQTHITFYKKKSFYIICIVLFSLLLIADVTMAVLVPEQTGSRFDSIQNMERTGYDHANSNIDSEGEEGGEMRSGDTADFANMPSAGMEDFEDMPSGDVEEFGDIQDSGDMPSDGNMNAEGDIPSFGVAEENSISSGVGTSFPQWVKSHWLFLFILLLVLDGASIFMLIWIGHKEKKQAQETEKETIQIDGEVHLAKPVKKKRHSHMYLIIPVIGVILLVAIVKILTGGSQSSASETEATVYSAEAELGDISTVLMGAGTLEEETAEALTLPEDVEIAAWYVSNGDSVQEGDILAQVDSVSVMTAIASVQDIIAQLDEELAEIEDDTISDEITASVSGRIMKIYAEEDASVVDIMYDNSSLILMSLDGLLAVAIETDTGLTVGDSVDVTLSDDTVISGKVESCINGTVVIVVSDEEASYDEEVTVSTEAGVLIGTGTLYIHSELKVTGFAGTISDIAVSVGDEVSDGDTLITLTDTEYTGEYELLLEQRKELEEQLQELFQLYQDGYIYASCSGVVSGLDVDDATDGDDTTDVSDAAIDTNVSSGQQYDGIRTEVSASIVQLVSKVLTLSSNYFQESNAVTTNVSAAFHDTSVNQASEAVSITYGDLVEGSSLTLTETSEGSSDYINYVGMVTSVEDGMASMKLLSGTYVIDDYSDISGIDISESAMTETMVCDLSTASVIFNSIDGGFTTGSLSSIAAGDILILAYDAEDASVLTFVVKVVYTGTSGTDNGGKTENIQQSGGDELSSDIDGMGEGEAAQSEMVNAGSNETGTDTVTTDSTGASSAVQGTEEEAVQTTYLVTETTWLSITPQETMTITITIDELDILSLETGQDALITLDAFPGQSFEGTVTSINTTGVNSGGSSKFTAEVSIDREEDMLAGMNASVAITLDTRENVLSVPEAALVEEGGLVYVYTSYEEDTETLGGLVEVTTGVSDGENVEILSGLEEGSEFYYSYLDVVNYTSSTSSASGGFSIDSVFSGRR